MTRGVIYFVIGQRYLAHAKNSLASLRRFHPDMHATLFCNDKIERGPFNQAIRYDSVNDQYPDNEIFLDRIHCLARSPYGRTLFLDADTYVDGSLDEAFHLLDKFDVAACQSAVGHTTLLNDVPSSFPEYSAGALLWRRNPVTRKLLENWSQEMARYIRECARFPGELRGHGAHSDQVPLRRVLWHGDVRIATLKSNHLCQVEAGGLLRGRAIILHGCRGHPGMLARAAKLINTGQPQGELGTFRFHAANGSVMELKPGRGLLPDDDWRARRKELIGA